MLDVREMKDSGVEWVGEIPTEWEVIKIKYVTKIRNENALFNPLTDKYIGLENVKSYSNEIVETNTEYTATVQSVCKKGDVMFAKLRPYLAKVLISPFDGFCTSEFLQFKDFQGNIRFLWYSLLNSELIERVNSSTYGTKMPRANTSFIVNLPLVYPDGDIQNEIAQFLDFKSYKMDEIVANVQKQVDILEQYKQSVITEVVTKGLNTNVEMKDSEIGWIGKTPSNWETRKIGRLFTLRNERNYKPLDEVRLLSLYTDIGVFPHGEQAERGNKAVQAEGYKIVKKNDIVVNIILAWMGAVGISNYDGVTSPAYDVYMSDTSKVVPHYYHYVFRTKAIAGECYKYGRGIMLMRWRTYSSEFKQITVPYPPIAEQQVIADYLDNKCAQIDKIIEEKKKEIETIEAYKKALIFEYVTGKKEV